MLLKRVAGIGSRLLNTSGSALQTIGQVGVGLNRGVSTYNPLIQAGVNAVGLSGAMETGGLSTGVAAGIDKGLNYIGSSSFRNNANAVRGLGNTLSGLGNTLGRYAKS